VDREKRIADEQFELLVNSVVDYAIFMLDTAGHVVTWNPGAERIKGYARDEIVGRHCSVFYPEDQRNAGLPERLLKRATERGSVQYEGWRVRRDGTRFWGDVLITALRSREGELRGYAKVTRDMTGRQRELVQRTLLAQAEKLAGVGSWEWDPVGGEVTWSDELYRILGLDPDAFDPSFEAYLERVHPDDRRQSATAVAGALLEGKPFVLQERVVRPDGMVRHLRSHGEVLRSERGETVKIVSACLDVTQERADQDALRSLTRRVVEAEENERRRIAQELHDRVGQNLSALNINLDIVQAGLEGKAELRQRVDDSLRLVESTLQSIENVMAELRPPLLDEYGVGAALGGFADDFSRRTGIRVDLREEPGITRGLQPPAALALFRIGQEALTNVAKHSGATTVDVEIKRAHSGLEVSIADDGAGFDVAAAGARGRWGMTTMRERAQAVGGHFSLQSELREGTIVRVWVPL
jgi:PAS domain S-box-containing protein